MEDIADYSTLKMEKLVLDPREIYHRFAMDDYEEYQRDEQDVSHNLVLFFFSLVSIYIVT